MGAAPTLSSPPNYPASRCAQSGFFAFYWLAAAVFEITFALAILGAMLFTLANNLYVQAEHAQLLTVSLAPLLSVLLWRTLQAFQRQAPLAAMLWGGGAAMLYGAWLLTAFYMAWFTTFFLVTMVVFAAVLQAAGHGPGWTAWRRVVAWPLAPIAVMLTASVTPFLLVYLPKQRETGAHPFAGIIDFLPTIPDLALCRHQQPCVRRLRPLDAAQRHPDRRRAHDRFPARHPDPGSRRRGLFSARPGAPAGRHAGRCHGDASSPSCCAWRVGHLTLWSWVYAYVPGASALRAIGRYPLFLTIPVVLLAIGFLQTHARRCPAFGIGLVAALLLVEEINLYTPLGLFRAPVRAALATIPPPPPSCRLFYAVGTLNPVTDGPDFIRTLYRHNVDAMLVAEMLAVPTINGLATFNPPDWSFADPQDPSYQMRVARYLAGHDVRTGACALDLTQHTWNPHPDLPLPQLEPGVVARMDEGGAGTEFTGAGWSAPEKTGRWTEGTDANLVFAIPGGQADGRPMTLQLVASPFTPPGGAPSAVKIDVNGTVVGAWQPLPGRQVLQARIPPGLIAANGLVHVQLLIASPYRPTAFGTKGDPRQLGLYVESVAVLPSPAPTGR